MTFSWPDSLAAIARWSAAHRVALNAARLRFVKFSVLDSIASDAGLSKILILRGSAALQLFYGGKRESADMDFVVLNIDGARNAGDDDAAPKSCLERVLADRLPQHFHGDSSWLTWFKSIKIDLTPAARMYDCVRVPMTSGEENASERAVLVATREVLIAEKLAAISEAIVDQHRKRRAHDVYDIACLLRGSRPHVDVRRIGQLLRRRTELEGRRYLVGEFDVVGRKYLTPDYDRLRVELGPDFIPFDEAWLSLTELVGQVDSQRQP